MNYDTILDCVSSTFAFVFFFWHAFQPFKIQYALFNGSYSRDPQVFYSEKKLKMNHTILFTHLKIILLQYFQFSVK